MLKVIGAGFPRTGTLSLKHALEELGFSQCYHMIEVFKNPEHLLYGNQHTNEKPWIGKGCLTDTRQRLIRLPVIIMLN
jgi:hypothetical protein